MALKVTLILAGVAVVLLYALYPTEAEVIISQFQLHALKAGFYILATVLIGYLGYSWVLTVRDSRCHSRRLQELEKTQEEIRRTRLQFQLEALKKAQEAEDEIEVNKRAAATEAAARAAEAKAEAALRQPGGGEKHASDEALAAVRLRQQAEAARAQADFLRRRREAQEEASRKAQAEAAAKAAEAKALSATRQPGGGTVHASEGSTTSARRKQQEELAGKRGQNSGSSSSTEKSTTASTVKPNQRSWDGPVFPGDELKGWVSPASEEASSIRAQQDAELARSLARDRQREEAWLQKEREEEERQARKKREEEEREEKKAILLSLVPKEPPPQDEAEKTLIAVRFPDSSIKKRWWMTSDTVEDLYNWVESDDMVLLRSFQLVEPFPRRKLSRSIGEVSSLKAANLIPKAMLVVELLDD